MYAQIIALVALVILSAFFSGSETALMSMSSLKVRHLVRQKKRGAQTLFKLTQKPHRLLVTLLIGNNIVNIAASALATVVATELLGSRGIGIAIGVVTLIVLVFGELTPKSLALRHAEKIALLVAPIMRALSYALYPLVVTFEALAKLIMRLFGKGSGKSLTVEELKTIVAVGREEGIIDRKLAKMMKNILEFRDTNAREIMTPIHSVKTLKAGARLKDVIGYVNRTPYSRYPIISESKSRRVASKIIGILDVDDILRAVSAKKYRAKIDTIAQPVKFIDGDTSIDDLFVAFEKKNLQLVIIVDENDKAIGIVTLEDILEEIVGEIFDKSEHKMRVEITKGELSLDAGTSIKALNKALDLNLQSKYFDTIAGLLEHKLARKPRRGDVVRVGKKIRLKVTSADKQGANRVKIIRR